MPKLFDTVKWTTSLSSLKSNTLEETYSDIKREATWSYITSYQASSEVPEEEIDNRCIAIKYNRNSIEEQMSFLFYTNMLTYISSRWKSRPCYKAKVKQNKNTDDFNEEYETSNKSEEVRKSSALKLLSKTPSGKIENDNEEEEEEEIEKNDWKINYFPDKMVEIQFINGHRYEGRMSMNKMEDEGVFMWNDGSRYEGQFIENAITGIGTMEWTDLSKYSGEFLNGIRHGIGIFFSSSSPHVYNGDWSFGIRKGNGSIRYSNDFKNWYEGQWKNNKPDGIGLRQYPSGGRYVGSWKDGQIHGTGTMVWSNGNVYRGEWKNGQMDGYGEYTWTGFVNNYLAHPAENAYYGSWKNGLRHGFGTLELVDGSKYVGLWHNGVKVPHGKITCSNGAHLFLKIIPSEDVISVKEEGIKFTKRISISEPFVKQKYGHIQVEMTKPKTVPKDYFFTRQNMNSSNVSRCIPITQGSQEIDLKYFISKLFKMSSQKPEPQNKRNFCMKKTETESMDYSQIDSSPIDTTNQDTCKFEEDREDNSMYDDWEIENEMDVQEHLLRNVVTLNLPYLRSIYKEYACIACDQIPTYDSILTRLTFWQFLRDCKIYLYGLSLSDVDIILASNPKLLIEYEHYPFERIHFWKFLMSLIELACHIYELEKVEINSPNISDGIQKQGIFGNALSRLINEIIKPNITEHVGEALFDLKDTIALEPMYIYFRGLGEPLSAKKLLRYICVRKGSPLPEKTFYEKKIKHKFYPPHILNGYNTVSFGNQIWFKNKDPPLIFSYLPTKEFHASINEKKEKDPYYDTLYTFRILRPKEVITCFSKICPTIKDEDGKINNMYYKMVYLEFLEVILLMSKKAIEKDKKQELYLEKMKNEEEKLKEESNNSQQ